MPAKQGFPRTDVTVWSIDSFKLCLHRILQKGIQVPKVPLRRLLVHKSVEQVSTIEGRGKDDIFPKLHRISVYHLLDFMSR